MNICVLIPAYNVAPSIASVIEKTKKTMTTIVVINDGSTDETEKRAQECGAIILHNTQNHGKGAALKKGFLYAIDNNYDAVITLDGDEQHNPDDIRTLLAAIDTAEILIGSRMAHHTSMPPLITLTNTLLSLLVSVIIRHRIYDSQSGFRLIKTAVLKRCILRSNHFEMETEQLIQASRLGFTIREVPIETIYHTRSLRPTIMRDTFLFIKLFFSLLVLRH